VRERNDDGWGRMNASLKIKEPITWVDSERKRPWES